MAVQSHLDAPRRTALRDEAWHYAQPHSASQTTTNRRHERMQRVLKKYAANPPSHSTITAKEVSIGLGRCSTIEPSLSREKLDLKVVKEGFYKVQIGEFLSTLLASDLGKALK